MGVLRFAPAVSELSMNRPRFRRRGSLSAQPFRLAAVVSQASSPRDLGVYPITVEQSRASGRHPTWVLLRNMDDRVKQCQ